MTDQMKRYIPGNAFYEALSLQWAQALRTMVDEGRLLPVSEFQSRREFSAEGLELAERESRVFHLAGANDATYYPAFFCDPDVMEGAELVSRRLGRLSGPDKWIFFLNSTHRLGGRTPIQALASGDLTSVLQAADILVSRRCTPAALPTPG